MARIDDRFITIDPGLGYGKRRLENYEILRRLDDLIELRHPVMVSPSRKPFLTESIRAPEADWLYSGAAAATVAVAGGAHIVRTNEVAETVSVVRAADRYFEAGGE
jgi:dihydropteroate synthase